MDPKVIFEDGDLMVLDKPAGMVVNKADTTKDQITVQDWVEDYLKVSNGKIKDPSDTSDTFVPVQVPVVIVPKVVIPVDPAQVADIVGSG